MRKAVNMTPTVARTTPCPRTGLISAALVSIPPENKIILNAITPINCAVCGLLNSIPKPSVPKSIPTPKKRSKAGTPKRKPAFPTTILTNNRMDPISKIFPAFRIISV